MSLLLLFHGGEAGEPPVLRDWSWEAGTLVSRWAAGIPATGSTITAGALLHQTSED